MIHKLYSILDVKVGYGMPIVQDNDAVALRNFDNACSDKSSVFHSHSSDFSLWYVGTFDTDSGIVTSDEKREICAAYDLVNRVDD